MARTDPHRHGQLRKLLQRLVSLSCPMDLRNHTDDIVQTVLIRLVEKLREVEARLWLWLENAEHDDTRLLEDCLKEIETFGNREAVKELVSTIKRCLSVAQPPVKRLRKSLIRLQETDGETIFAGYYVRRSVHWSIGDEIKKLNKRPDAQPYGDGGPSTLPQPRTASLAERLAIRQAVQDCLVQMSEHMRLPTVLALQGHKIPEIAELLGLKVRQTESRVRRGRDFLRECLNRKGVGR